MNVPCHRADAVSSFTAIGMIAERDPQNPDGVATLNRVVGPRRSRRDDGGRLARPTQVESLRTLPHLTGT